MNPWLSVLIPVYNVRPYLSECVVSVLDQVPDESGVEVLLYEDASTDTSRELAQRLADAWPTRVRLLQGQQNSGLSVARNRLADAAAGDYLWFVDSDDKLLPGVIASLRSIVQQHAPDMVLCDFRVWREVLKLKHRLRGESHKRTFVGPSRQLCQDTQVLVAGMLNKGRLHAWSKISRRALWRAAPGLPDLLFPPGRSYEDLSTMSLLALRTQSFYYEPAPWVAYRQRADSILATPDVAKAMDQSSSMCGFAEQLRTTPGWADRRIRIALARQAARNLAGAMRVLCREASVTSEPAQFLLLAEQVREDFLHTSPLAPDELARWYARRGWWLQRRTFLRWFHARPAQRRCTG